MLKEYPKNMLPLVLLELLKEQTNINKCLTVAEIIEKLCDDYKYHLTAKPSVET